MELEDLAKMYLRDVIMKECWESMVTKGRSIKVTDCKVRSYTILKDVA